jgi:hypothetical protein
VLSGVGTPVLLTPFEIDRGDEVEKVWFNFALTPVCQGDRQAIGIFCVITESTSQVLARESIEQLNQTLEEKVATS